MRLDDFELISQVSGPDKDGGIYPDGYFTWSGCDNVDCEAHNLGATVFDCQGYRTLAEAQGGEDNLYEFALCFNCIYEHEYGERPE